MVEGHPVGHPAPAVVATDEEALEAELAHHRDLVRGHRPFGVGRVIWGRGWLGGVAVAPEVAGDYREVFGEPGGYLVPHDVRLGVAVEQQVRLLRARPQPAGHGLT